MEDKLLNANFQFISDGSEMGDAAQLRYNDTLFNTIPDAIISSDVDGKVTTWNKCAEELYGFSSEEMIGQIMPAIIHTEFINKEQQNLKEIFEKDGHWKGDVLQTCKNGKKIYVSSAANVIRNTQDKIIGYVAVNRDISLQKQAEQKLLKNEQDLQRTQDQLELSINAGKIGLWRWDVKNDVLNWSKEQKIIYGLEPSDELINVAQYKALVIPEDWEQLNKVLGSATMAAEQEYDFRIIRKNDGELRWIKSRAKNIVNEHGELSFVTGVNIDISEQMFALTKIAESEVFSRTALESSPDCVKVINTDGQLTYMNYNGLCLLEVDDFNNIENKPWVSLWNEDNKPTVKEAVDKSLAGITSHFQAMRPTSKGNFKWWDVMVSPIIKPNGDVSQLIAVSRDITSQMEARKKIEEGEQRLRLATVTSGVGIWEWNLFTNKVRWDDQMFQLYGVIPTVDGFVDYQTWCNAVVPEHLAEQERILQQTAKNGGRSNRSFKILRANDAVLCDIEATETARMNAQGEIEWVVGTNMDVTERKKAEETIKESEERFRSLAQTLPQLVWVTDARGSNEFTSLRWKEYSGIEPGGEKEMKAIVHPDDYDNTNKVWLHSLTTGKIYNTDVRLKNKNGEYRWHTVIGEPVLDSENKIIKWVGAFTDIHEQKNIEENLELKVAERTEELRQMNAELEFKNKELESFNFITSHDLQEPLRKIQTFAGRIAEKENLSDTGKDYFKRMIDAATHMRTLIKDLLSYSQVTITESRFEILDLNKIIEEVKTEFKETLEEKHATIEAKEMCEIKVVPFQFRQLMHNLIGNALKFCKQDVAPHIIIKSEQLSSYAPLQGRDVCHISITDNGIGFENHFSEKIFEVFKRLHGKEKYPGTGIGLAIVKKVVENHHGIITVESELGKGTTFNIYLPV